MMTHQTIAWEWLAGLGLEHLVLAEHETAIRAEGWVVGQLVGSQLAGEVIKVHYAVTCKPDWGFVEAKLEMDSQKEGRQVLAITRGEDGAWQVNGEVRADLAGCTEIDIRTTPFTNTLPIRRLQYEVNAPQTMTVAFIKAPTLAVEAVRQEYTKLDEAGSRFRYRNLESGYTADLTVDAAGLVVDYPEAWRRIGVGS
jgi:uncharacterized protein